MISMIVGLRPLQKMYYTKKIQMLKCYIGRPPRTLKDIKTVSIVGVFRFPSSMLEDSFFYSIRSKVSRLLVKLLVLLGGRAGPLPSLASRLFGALHLVAS